MALSPHPSLQGGPHRTLQVQNRHHEAENTISGRQDQPTRLPFKLVGWYSIDATDVLSVGIVTGEDSIPDEVQSQATQFRAVADQFLHLLKLDDPSVKVEPLYLWMTF